LRSKIRLAGKGSEGIYNPRPAAAPLPVSAFLSFSLAVGHGRFPALADEYDWSDSVSNLSAKLQRESIRYKEVVELADVLDCDIVWMKRGARR
jgi:hypothetical protein